MGDPGALERRFPHIDESGKKKEKKERAKSPIRKKKEVKKEEKREFATKAERRRAKDANNLALPTGGATPTPTSSAKPKRNPQRMTRRRMRVTICCWLNTPMAGDPSRRTG